MALGIRLVGGPLTSDKSYEMTNARATELIDAFISDRIETMPEELTTVAEQAQWKLDAARQKLQDYFVKEVAQALDRNSGGEIEAIRAANRQKAKLE